MTDFKNDSSGGNAIFLDCPMCDFIGDVYYHRKQPKYCTPACKAKAYRQRKKEQAQTGKVVAMLNEWSIEHITTLSPTELYSLKQYVKEVANHQKGLADSSFLPHTERQNALSLALILDGIVAHMGEKLKNVTFKA